MAANTESLLGEVNTSPATAALSMPVANVACMGGLVPAASAGDDGHLRSTGGVCICTDEHIVARQANATRVQDYQALEHFFHHVLWAVDKLFHDAANVPR